MSDVTPYLNLPRPKGSDKIRETPAVIAHAFDLIDSWAQDNANGTPGTRASRWFVSAGDIVDPDDIPIDPVEGDLFLYPVSRDVFQYLDGEWVFSVNIPLEGGGDSSTLITDDFERPDGALGGAWTASELWSLDSGRAVIDSDPTGFDFALRDSEPTGTWSMDTTIREIAPWESDHIHTEVLNGTCRWTDEDNYLLWYLQMRYEPKEAPVFTSAALVVVTKIAGDFAQIEMQPAPTGLLEGLVVDDKVHVGFSLDAAGHILATVNGLAFGGTVPPDSLAQLTGTQAGMLAQQNTASEFYQAATDFWSYDALSTSPTGADVAIRAALAELEYAANSGGGGAAPIRQSTWLIEAGDVPQIDTFTVPWKEPDLLLGDALVSFDEENPGYVTVLEDGFYMAVGVFVWTGGGKSNRSMAVATNFTTSDGDFFTSQSSIDAGENGQLIQPYVAMGRILAGQHLFASVNNNDPDTEAALSVYVQFARIG